MPVVVIANLASGALISNANTLSPMYKYSVRESRRSSIICSMLEARKILSICDAVETIDGERSGPNMYLFTNYRARSRSKSNRNFFPRYGSIARRCGRPVRCLARLVGVIDSDHPVYIDGRLSLSIYACARSPRRTDKNITVRRRRTKI